MSASGDLPDPWDRFDPDDGVLVLPGDDARLLMHLLDTFERLLRNGDLTERQLEFLTPEGTGPAHSADDLMLAQVVSEALATLRSQLDE